MNHKLKFNEIICNKYKTNNITWETNHELLADRHFLVVFKVPQTVPCVAIKYVELAHECCPQHLRMGTARINRQKSPKGLALTQAYLPKFSRAATQCTKKRMNVPCKPSQETNFAFMLGIREIQSPFEIITYIL